MSALDDDDNEIRARPEVPLGSYRVTGPVSDAAQINAFLHALELRGLSPRTVRAYRMTLRYTEITLETVGQEYKAALVHIEKRYRQALIAQPQKVDPDEALNAIIRWVQKRAGDAPEARHRAELLVKRLKRIREEVSDL